MARDRYTNKYECPKCGLAGAVVWSEDSMNFHSDLNVQGVSSAGFHIVQIGSNSDTKEPWCVTCNVAAVPAT